jgi:anti-sigma B factor antagonist
MPFTVKDHQDISVVAIRGKFLGTLERDAFKSAVDKLKDNGTRSVVIDLGSADFMDSTAIGLLISALTTIRGVDGDVVIAGLNKRIKNLFVMTRLLGPVFRDFETVDEAVAAFNVTA